MSSRLSILSVSLLLVFLAGCNFPGAEPTPTSVEIDVAAAQTVSAQLTEAARATPAPGSETPERTSTSAPQDTPTLTRTLSPTPGCTNRASFVTDVTIPDGTLMLPNQAFDKTWRLRNAGTCTWTTQYDVVFSAGNSLSGPASQPLVGSVPSGATVDLTVSLVSPASNGTYKGDWMLRDDEDVIFALGPSGTVPFFVEIVVGPTPTPEPVTKELGPSSSGAVKSDGGTIAFPNSGDTGADVGMQGFLTFDLSSIPDGSSIVEVKLDLTSYDVLGDPFGDLGCVRVYLDNYGNLDAGDYTPPPVTGALWRFCSEAQLGETDEQIGNQIAIDGVQAALAGNTFQLRLQFNETQTDSDGDDDTLRPGNPKLFIAYLEP